MMRSSRRDKATVLRSLLGEIEAACVDTVLMSAEHLSSRFSATHIQELAADFSNYDCLIAVVVRDHVSRALSAYSTSIASGRHLTLDDFVNEICHPHNNYIRYRETITQWEAIFGEKNIIVISYNDKDIITVLAKNLISLDISSRRNDYYDKNKSIAAPLLESDRLANEAAAKYRWRVKSKFNPLAIAARIRHAMTRNAIESSQGRLRLDEEQFRRVNEIADIDRRWLADHYHVQLENFRSDGDAP